MGFRGLRLTSSFRVTLGVALRGSCHCKRVATRVLYRPLKGNFRGSLKGSLKGSFKSFLRRPNLRVTIRVPFQGGRAEWVLGL